MAAIHLILAAALALLQALVGLGNRIPDSSALQGAVRVTRSTCPTSCPDIRNRGTYNYETPFYFTPNHSAVKITLEYTTSIGVIYENSKVNIGQTEHLTNTKPGATLKYTVSDPILYCNGRNINPDCLTITTITTTLTTSTSTTPISEAVTAIDTTTTQEIIIEDFQGLEVFLLILSIASVLLWMVLVLKSCLNYYRTVTGLDRSIASDKERASDVSTSLLYSLRDALVLDFGLRLCLCVLLLCVCVCTYGLYLTMTQDTQNFSVPFYILGAACLLVHGFFCTKKVNSIIKTVIVVQQKPRPTSRRRRRRYSSSGEDGSVSENIEEVLGCPNNTVVAVLKVCLLLLLLCLCVLTFGFCIAFNRVKEAAQATAQGTSEPAPPGDVGGGNRP